MHIQSLSGAWQFRQAGTEEWLPAKVPGGVHTDLLAAGRIPDPFAADNEKRVQWVAESDWEYRCTFTCAPHLLAEEQVWLVCDGLDTLATVTLNGQELGRASNMFRQYHWDVKPFLRTQDAANELHVRFASPVRYVTEKQKVRPLPGVSQAIPGGPHLRKAPCQFGWDWGPQLPPSGIWKDMRLNLVVDLASHSFARLLELSLEGAGVIWSGNYFDLPASRTITVSCPLPSGWTLAQARTALKLRSIYDTYAHGTTD